MESRKGAYKEKRFKQFREAIQRDNSDVKFSVKLPSIEPVWTGLNNRS